MLFVDSTAVLLVVLWLSSSESIYADDLTIITSFTCDSRDHQSLLSFTTTRCQDIDDCINQDKSYSLSFKFSIHDVLSKL